MQRSRLKNIINKSKEFSIIGESPFEQFKNSLPKNLEIGENYRLESAWKAYGSPKNYQEALWEGLIQPIDENTFKLPSIGYNEETKEYEYLNKGRENETVAKDIRVWDNDVIPLVKELKQGGYVRTFNKEKDCWTYCKNLQPEIKESRDEINSFKEGGKTKRNKTDIIIQANNSDVPFMKRILNNDNRKVDLGNGQFGTHLLGYGEIDGKTYVYPQIQDVDGNLKYFNDWKEALNNAIKNKNTLEMSPEEAEWFTSNYKWFYPNYFGKNPYPNNPQAFKQGGQMNVIPEGALHAHKNHMELAEQGEITKKGVPVVDNNGEQQAEIERNEIIFTKEVTNKIEEAYKKFNSEEISNSEKDEVAIKIGKFLTKQIIENTDDKTGLIQEVEQKM